MRTVLCIVSVLLAVVLVYAEPPEEIKKIFEECKSEIGLTDIPKHDDPNSKCFHACMLKKTGSLENGKINPEKHIEFSKKNIPKFDDKIATTITECVETANEESEECEVAAVMHKCMMDKIGHHPH